MDAVCEEDDIDAVLEDLSSNYCPVSDSSSLTSETIVVPSSSSGSSSELVIYDPDASSAEEFKQSWAKPKILKCDIRRSYSNMFANVINSGNFPLLYGMMETFFLPGFEQRRLRRNKVTQQPYCVIRRGISAVASLWYSIMNKDPDPLADLKDTKIHLVSTSPCSVIVSKFHFSATSIYDEEDSESDNDEGVEYCGNSDGVHFYQKSNSTWYVNKAKRRRMEHVGNPRDVEEASDMDNIVESLESFKRSLSLRKKPLPYAVEGTFTMHTDENKFITRIDLETKKLNFN